MSYSNFSLHGVSNVNGGAAVDGIFTLAECDPGHVHLDLVYIKTRNNANDTVEMTAWQGHGGGPAGSQLHRRIWAKQTAFKMSKTQNGQFILKSNRDLGYPDLYFIKYVDTESKKVEVHHCAGPYYTNIVEYKTAWDLSMHDFKTARFFMQAMSDPQGTPNTPERDLVAIWISEGQPIKWAVCPQWKKWNSPGNLVSDTLEVKAEKSHGQFIVAPTSIANMCTTLTFIKTNNGASGKVEVHHIAAYFQKRREDDPTVFGKWLFKPTWTSHGTTAIGATDEWGIYLVDYWNPRSLTSLPDLIYIKTSHTGSGALEVHVLPHD